MLGSGKICKMRLYAILTGLLLLGLGACGPLGVGGTPYTGLDPGSPFDGAVIGGGGSFVSDTQNCTWREIHDPTGPRCGLRGQYFMNSNFEGSAIEKLDNMIRFWSGTGYGKYPDWSVPGVGSPTSDFSVRWEGLVVISKPVQLCLYSDDQARVLIDGAMVLNAWDRHSPEERCSAPLTVDHENVLRSIKVEYVNYGNGGVAILMFKNGLNEQSVPQGDLLHQP
jgi:hypothetical protein